MTLVRVRKQGNSMVVTLAQEVLDEAKIHDGDYVKEHVDKQGRIVIAPVTVQPRISPKMAAATSNRSSRSVADASAGYQA